MPSKTNPVDYTSCGSTNFIHSKKIVRIAEMVEQVNVGSRNSVVRKKAFELAKDVCDAPLNIKGMADDDLIGIANAIFVWVRDYIAYINDPVGEYFQPPVKTMEISAGDCDDQSILLAAMLGSIGFEPILVILPEHVYVELQIDDKQLPMDPTVPNAAIGVLSASMVEHFKEKYGLDVDDYLRIPIANHLVVTATKQVVTTKTPLSMAMYLETKAAASYDEGDYQVAEPRFIKAAKMYHDAGLHAASDDSRDGLFASSNFCAGWAHLMQVMSLVSDQKHNDLHLLQSEIHQAISCFGESRSYFEKYNVADVAREVDALESILVGHQETLLADYLIHNGDYDASLRHYGKAKEMYREAMVKTECSGLIRHAEQSLESVPHHEGMSQMAVNTAVNKSQIPDGDDFSERFDISPEDLKKIQERLVNVTGKRLKNEFLTLSIKTGIPTNMLEAIHSRTVEISLRVDYPDPKIRYGNVVRVHPQIMERLGLYKIDSARIVFGGMKYVTWVQPLDVNEDYLDVIKVNQNVRDMLGAKVGDTVRLERAYVEVEY